MAAMYVLLLLAWPDLARDVFLPLDPFDGGDVQVVSAESPDERFVAATEWQDQGGLGRGPYHVSVAPRAHPGRKTTVYVSAGWWWRLVPAWPGPRRLEISVLTDREPTLEELAKRVRTVSIGGERVEVSLVYREPRPE